MCIYGDSWSIIIVSFLCYIWIFQIVYCEGIPSRNEKLSDSHIPNRRGNVARLDYASLERYIRRLNLGEDQLAYPQKKNLR